MNCTHRNCFKFETPKTCRCADAVVAWWMSFGTRSSSRRNALIAWNTREVPSNRILWLKQTYKVVLKLLLPVNSWTFLLFLCIGVFVPNLPRCCLAHSIQSHLSKNHDHLLPTSTRTLPILFWNRTHAFHFCRNWSRSVNRSFRRSNKYTSAWRNAQKRAPAKRQRLFLYLQDVSAKIVFLLCKLQTVVVCNKRYLSAVLWIRRYPWMESELESLFSGHYQIGWFQTEDNIPKVSSLFVWVVWRRKCLEMLRF